MQDIQLDEAKKAQLDGNIKKMLEGGATEEDVIQYASDFKNKFGQKKSPASSQSSDSQSQSLLQEGKNVLGGGVFKSMQPAEKEGTKKENAYFKQKFVGIKPTAEGNVVERIYENPMGVDVLQVAPKKREEKPKEVEVKAALAEKSLRGVKPIPKSVQEGVELDKTRPSNWLDAQWNIFSDMLTSSLVGVGEYMQKRQNANLEFAMDISGETEERKKAIREGFYNEELGEKARTKLESALRSPKSSKEQERKLTEFDIFDGVSQSDFWGALNAAPSQILNMGIGAVTGMVNYAGQAADEANQELKKSPEYKNLSESDKLLYISSQMITTSLINKLPIDILSKKTGIANSIKNAITNKVLKQFRDKGVKATTQQLEAALANEVGSFAKVAKRVGVNTALGFVLEPTQEGVEAAAKQGIKIATNRLKDREIFDEEDIKKNFWKNVGNSMASALPVGVGFGAGAAKLNNTKKAIRNEISKALSAEDVQKPLQEINTQFELGNLTEDEASALGNKVQEYAEIAGKIPQDIDSKTKYAIIGGIEQRNEVESEIKKVKQSAQGLDQAFLPEKESEIRVLEGKLGQINDYLESIISNRGLPKYVKEGDKYYKVVSDGRQQTKTEITKEHFDIAELVRINEDKKQKQQSDAIQEQTAGKVPVQSETTVGEEVEGGKPKTEFEEVATIEGDEKEVGEIKKSISVQTPQEVKKGQEAEVVTIGGKEYTPETKKSGVSVVLPTIKEQQIATPKVVEKKVEVKEEVTPVEVNEEEVVLQRQESEPPTVEGGRKVATISGLTEEERVEKVEKRKKSTKLTTEEELRRELVDLANSLGTQRGIEKANTQAKIRQKILGLNAEAGFEKYRFDGVRIRKRTESKTKGVRYMPVSSTSRDISGSAIKDDAVLLTDRSPEFTNAFEALIESPALEALQVDRGDGISMTKNQIESALEDILDGIPSVAADNLLNTLEEGFNRGFFDLRAKDLGIEGTQTVQAMLDEFIGAEKEVVGQPMDEEALLKFLEEESKLESEEDIELLDNIENLITEYESEPTKTITKGEVSSTKTEPETRVTEQSKPTESGKGEGKPKAKVSRQPDEKAEPKGEDVDSIEKSLKEKISKDDSFSLSVLTLPKEKGKINYKDIKVNFSKLDRFLNNPEALEGTSGNKLGIYNFLKSGGKLPYDRILLSKDDNQLLDGNNRVRAMLALGITDFDYSYSNEKFMTGDSYKTIAEEYVKAKADGSNPELVKAVEELLSEPKKEAKQTKAEGEPKPKAVEKKEEAPKKISDKAREQAAKLRSGEANVLPDWLRANLPKGTKKQGLDINEVYANALEVFAETYDKLGDFKKAVDEAFKGISDWFKENGIDVDEADIKSKFEAQLREEQERKAEEIPIEQKMRSFYKNVIERSKGLTKEQKELLKADPNALYNVLPVEESKRIARDVIEEIGVESAVLEASKSNSAFEPVERVMILGAAMDYYAAKAKNAKTQEGFNKAADNEIDAQQKMLNVAAELGTLGTAYGRAINIFKEVYKLSSFALERKLKENVKKINELRNPKANEEAKEVKKIISNDEEDIKDAAKELTETQLMREADAIRKVQELEKEVENLKKEILQRDNAAKGTKKNPLKIKRITNDSEYDKRVKEFKQRQRSIISKDDITDLTYFGLYHIENGITKFADWYNVMSKEFKGFKDKLGEIYVNARGKAVENGADEKIFDNDEAVQKYFDDVKSESDAKKIANASKKVAVAKFNEAMANNPDRARVLAPRMAAERIRKDAARNLDMPSTQTEQTYLKRLIQVVNQKAKEYYKEKKENISNINDILAFAIANGKSDYAIWERTQQEVQKQIDEDTSLTDEQKQEVKDFLSDYQNSIFDTLMTEKQIDQLVREKLIESGYGIEKTVNGKVVKSVDWSKVIGSAKTINEARENIAKAITSLGFTEQQAKGEIDAAIQAFDSKVAEKKEKAINAFLNKSIVNKAKSALGVKKKVPKSKISQMIDLNNKGMLDNDKIKDVLAEELGLIELTKEDIDKVKELAELIEDESIPRFIKRQFEEQMQYIFDSKSGNVDYLENREAVTNNRLSSAYNQVQNATGFFRTFTTAFTQAIKTGSPKQIAKVFGREFVNSLADAKSILFKGRVSRGSAFSDLTRVTEGEPRVRFLEYGKGEFLGGKFLGKPIYAKLGGKAIDLNIINQAYKRVKYIQRLLEAVDTFSSSVVSGLTQYGQIKNQVDRFYPELSGKEKSKIVWDMMYSLDRTKETENAIKGLQKAGIENPTTYEINRAINEKIERERNKKISDEFYKNVESLKPMAKTKLKGEGNANPTEEEIQEEAYKMLGYDEPLDVVARGERQAGRETGKTSTFGITSAILLPVDGINYIIRNISSKKTPIATNMANALDFTMSQLFPFVHSIARWTEMQLELTPYGLLKGAIYKTGLPKQFEGKAKIPMQEYKEIGDDFIIRSILGAGYTVLGMFGIGLIKNLVGDEDEAEDAVKGTKQDENFTQERVKSVGQPKQSVKIGGYNLPLQLLGNQGVVLGMYSDFNRMKKDPEMQEKGMVYISALVAMNVISEATWYSNASKYGGIGSSFFQGKEEKYEPALGRIVGGVISSQIPYNRLQTEAATVLKPQSKQSVDFGINVLNQMSIVRSFSFGKPNFDYRGRTYDYGDIYVNSADGIVKMFSKSKYGDDADRFLSEINFAATDAYRETKDAETYKYAITEKDGTKRFMTNDEYYDFKLKTGKTFDELIKKKYQAISKQTIKVSGKINNTETMKVKKEMASFLLDYSKKIAFLDIQKKTGFSPYESEKDIEIKGEIKEKKEEMYEKLGLDKMKESIKEKFPDN